ncbi:molybdate ABC transporter substrate-binding protein [Caulobacter sp. Root1455]|uniref:molybdate ABC transporter substrate-binding protein n=1 Tax=Caulobacter sp. Root1455 TaxID=1736465 RepID=UPI0006FE0D9C|nr:molybdate ABC transporter substrate-binding protein [Caulobacter sp. Root1455]KQY95203.1 molybdate ABC transporter substrate-binding protein [Caulobacter sp. Root1455]
MITGRFKFVGLALFGGALALFASLGAAPALAADTQVAVAANFTEPAKEIAAAFKAKTGHTAVLSFGASGQFYTQMAHGAPYEVFLSADAERPRKAEQEGLAVAGTRYTYAVGRLVLYSKTPGLVDAKGAVLGSDRFVKLAIADPAAAPYGRAAVETLRKLKLYDALAPRIVTGSSIAQTYQYVATGNAELGFVALSQVIGEPGGSRWLTPATLHAPIAQQAVLLKTGEKNPAARAFLTFLRSPAAVTIIKRYGYEVRP